MPRWPRSRAEGSPGELLKTVAGSISLVPARELTTLLQGGAFFEGPRWRDGRWWVSDFYRHTVMTVAPDGSAATVMSVEQPSGLGWMPDGSLLVVSMKDHRVLRRKPTGEVSVHADLTAHCAGHLNDMVVDSQGHAYVGEFGFDLMAFADAAPGKLMRVDPDGSVTVLDDDMRFSNGAVITPDGSTLIVGETAGARYTAFTLAGDGSVSDRRVWAQVAFAPELGPLAETLPQLKFAPDGCTLDAEGCVWAADSMHQRCARLAPGGAILEEILTDIMFDLPSRDDVTEVRVIESTVTKRTAPLLEISPKRQKKEA